VIRAPACGIDVSVRSDTHGFHGEEVDLSGGGVRELRIELARACGVLVELRDGDAPIAIPDSLYIDVEPAAGGFARTFSTRTPVQVKVTFPEPGSYRVTVPKLSGYVEPPPRTVEIPAGTYVELAIALERERP
jgi:hypothetical protein